MNIFIADDDRITRMMLGRQLSILGYKIFEAENGQELLKLLENKEKAHIIFLDREMPIMDGLTTMIHIKKNPQWQDIPIVMLTGAGSPEKINQGIIAGSNYYLVKPFEIGSIILTIQEIKEKMMDTLIDNVVIAEAQKLMGEKFPIVIRYYVDDTENYIKQLYQHLQEGDEVSLTKTAHTIKSSSMQVGAIQIIKVAAEIELNAHHKDTAERIKLLQEIFEHTKAAMGQLCEAF